MELEKLIKDILNPFTFSKYGKVYVGYEKTEGALRIEGLVLQMENEMKKFIKLNDQRLLKEIKDKLPKEREYGDTYNGEDESWELGEMEGFNKCLKNILAIITNLEKR